MYPLILLLHIAVCVGVILIVLLQAGKGAGLSGLFGGGTSDQLFSAPTGSVFLKKVTTAMAIIFVVTSVLLTFHAARRETRSVVERFPVAPAPRQSTPPPTARPASSPSTPK